MDLITNLLTLCPQERRALGCWKALEFSNSIAVTCYKNYQFSAAVKRAIQEREIVLGTNVFCLKSHAVRQIIDTEAQLIDYELEKNHCIKELARFSRILCEELLPEIMVGLRLVIDTYQDYPAPLVSVVVANLMPVSSSAEIKDALIKHMILNRLD